MRIKEYFNNVNIVNKLLKRIKVLMDSEKRLKGKDPFWVEQDNEGNRNEDAIEDEVQDQIGHNEAEYSKKVLNEEKKEIENTLGKIKKGRYGICERCNRKIDEQRMKAYPSAKLCLSCEKRIEKK